MDNQSTLLFGREQWCLASNVGQFRQAFKWQKTSHMITPVKTVRVPGENMHSRRGCAFPVRHIPFLVRHIPFLVRHIPFPVRHIPFPVRHIPFPVRHMPIPGEDVHFRWGTCPFQVRMCILGEDESPWNKHPHREWGCVSPGKVCSVNFEPPTESPWTNALQAQVWFFPVKMTSSWHDLINKACPRSPNR